jgi:plastocyanin
VRGAGTSVRWAGGLAATLLAVVIAEPARGASHAVTFADQEDSVPYKPATLEVAVNDTVTFTGPFKWHPLVWNGGTFPKTSSGTSATFTFTTSGTFRYVCDRHDDMKGVVTAAAAPGNLVPSADFTAAPASPRAGEVVTFAATGSDPDGTIVRFEWDLDGNGSFEAQGATASRTFAAAGAYPVGVRSVDSGGATSPASVHDVVVAAPGGGSGGSPLPDTAAPTARLLSKRLRPRAGVVALRIDLDEPASVQARIRAGNRTLARAKRSLPSGNTVRLRLPLTKAGRSALRRSSRVRATLMLVLRDAAGNRSTLTRTVTLRP